MQKNPKPKEPMPNSIIFKLPYPFRHLTGEIKKRGGRFDSTTKTWSLPDNSDNHVLISQIEVPPPKPEVTTEDRVRGIATVAVELLNGLKLGHFTLCQATADRVVIEQI